METRQVARAGDVVLVQMPFAVASWPSLALSLLKSAMREQHIAASINYLNLVYLDAIGPETYEEIALGMPNNCDLLGEWIFSQALWGDTRNRDAEYLEQVLGGKDPAHRKVMDATERDRYVNIALRARSAVPGFLDRCLTEVDWLGAQIVGFTSVFQQHVASLALAKRLKQHFPHLTIIFGGANCEGEMGQATLDIFPFVDAVCSGEGDEAFPQFVETLLGGKRVLVPGITTRADLTRHPHSQLVGLSTPAAHAPPIMDMDRLPYPDYSEFFEAASHSSSTGSLPLRMVFETSRGCWWGQKHHCTFCGLNGLGMAFRHKTAPRALAELQWLIRTYGTYTNRVSAADNIMPLEYFRSFLPELEQLRLNLDLFYETKSNLNENQVAQYKRAGLSQIQPGIESMSTSVLTLMRKGVSALQNIQLLKWCAQYGVHPHWNYLFGFPGETPNDYDGQASLLAKLVHLTPPVGCAPVRFDRFSPYHKRPEEFGLKNLHPYPAYSHIYPSVSASDVMRLAYYFVGDFAGKEQILSYVSGILGVVKGWKQNADRATLCHSTDDGRTIVFDGRGAGEVAIVILEGIHSAVLNHCASITSAHTIVAGLSRSWTEIKLRDSLDVLVSYGFLVEENGRYLAVSVPLGFEYAPPELARLQILEQVRTKEDVNEVDTQFRIPVDKCTIVC